MRAFVPAILNIFAEPTSQLQTVTILTPRIRRSTGPRLGGRRTALVTQFLRGGPDQCGRCRTNAAPAETGFHQKLNASPPVS